jgi:hypothetical protein
MGAVPMNAAYGSQSSIVPLTPGSQMLFNQGMMVPAGIPNINTDLVALQNHNQNLMQQIQL